MDLVVERRGAEALRAYVTGDTAEPDVLSAFRGVPAEDRVHIVSLHRDELEAIDGARLLILESMLVPLAQRSR